MMIMNMWMQLKNLLVEDERGQGMVEYALIIALIAIVVIVALTPAGAAVSQIFTNIVGALTPAAG